MIDSFKGGPSNVKKTSSDDLLPPSKKFSMRHVNDAEDEKQNY